MSWPGEMFSDQAGSIDADCSRLSAFLLQSCGGTYIVARFLGSVTWPLADHGNPSPSVRCGLPTIREFRDDKGVSGYL